ncbi:hypothetical protein, partial [Curtobacterium herbarum]|uniref:hypothetical protein n=1 Tax=Curtobacterium herbarum TaxID=150122 RepID=UPI001C8DDC2A
EFSRTRRTPHSTPKRCLAREAVVLEPTDVVEPSHTTVHQIQWLIPKERTGGVVILSVEANQHKARSELQWRMVPLEGRRALGFRSSRSAAPLG